MRKHVELLLKLGLAFAFLYPPVAAYFDPNSWIGFFPDFLRNLFEGNDQLLLHTFGIVEIILALWVLFGKRVFWPSLVMSEMLAGIVVFNWSQMDIVFRDVSILAMALALALLSKNH